MAAVIDLHTGERVLDAPRRPHLRLVQGGRHDVGTPAPVAGRSQPSQRTYLVRRIAAVAVAVVVVLAVAQVLAGMGRIVASELDSAPDASGQVHVVQPGDTAWEIAGRLAPDLDRRVAVDQLLALNGQGAITVGQELQLPASFDRTTD